jgi:Xaa-Pro aminopeptidase
VRAQFDRASKIPDRGGIDALLVSQPENRRYASGFTGSTAWLLISRDGALIATDSRYWEQAAEECPDYELVKVQGGAAKMLPEMLARLGVRRAGFESQSATYAEVDDWRAAAPDCNWIPTKDLVIGIRAVKDADELAVLRQAIRLADEALADTLAKIRPGMTEREVAWLIESYLRTHGAESVSFDTIVASGPNGARPHARAGDAPIVAGEPIVIDMGARLGGYCSDITRTVCLGQPNDPERFWAVYETVLKAQLAAEAAIRPDASGQAVDAIARDLITAAGYGENFGHGLGHGVGLAVHEAPVLSRTVDYPLMAGQVVTVEPGIYLTGWGGVRIEDIVAVTENGVEVLTAAPKDPIIPLA